MPQWLPQRLPPKGQVLGWLVDRRRPRDTRELARTICSGHPLRVVDVGAANGPEDQLAPIMPYADVLGFDADEAEAKRLNEHAAKARLRVRIEPFAVGGEDEERPFYICRKRDTSSLLPPDLEFQSAFPERERLEVVDITTVRTRHFGRLLAELRLSPEYLKLDAHGVERDLLLSLTEDQWDGLLAVHTEVLFAPLFIGQGEFGELDAALRGRGFRIIQLRRSSGRRNSAVSRVVSSRGQLRFGDALYVRDQSQLDASQRRRLALIAAVFRHYDLSLDLVSDDLALTESVLAIARRPHVVRALASAMTRIGQVGEALGPRCPAWETDSPREWI